MPPKSRFSLEDDDDDGMQPFEHEVKQRTDPAKTTRQMGMLQFMVAKPPASQDDDDGDDSDDELGGAFMGHKKTTAKERQADQQQVNRKLVKKRYNLSDKPLPKGVLLLSLLLLLPLSPSSVTPFHLVHPLTRRPLATPCTASSRRMGREVL